MPVRGTADGCHLTWRRLFSSPEARAASVPPVCARLPKTDGISRLLTAKAVRRRTGSLGRLAHWRFWPTSRIPQRSSWPRREVKARFGTIDAVVCNAGIAEQKLFQNITDADWMRMLDVNLMGTVRTIRAVLPEMLHNHKGKHRYGVVHVGGSAARPARAIIPRARLRLSA